MSIKVLKEFEIFSMALPFHRIPMPIETDSADSFMPKLTTEAQAKQIPCEFAVYQLVGPNRRGQGFVYQLLRVEADKLTDR